MANREKNVPDSGWTEQMRPANTATMQGNLAALGHELPLWAYKLARRVLTLKEPGVYALALIVMGDGRRELVVSGSKKELLGR